MLLGKIKHNLKVEGMHCEHCAARVEKAIKDLGGKATVDLSSGNVEAFLPKAVTPEAIKKAIDALGFKCTTVD